MSLTTVVHILAGGLALLAGYTALFTRKGAATHPRSGRVFVYAMVVMALTGAAMAALHGVRTDALMGLLTIYLVVTGLTTIRRPGLRPRVVDGAAMALGFRGRESQESAAVGCGAWQRVDEPGVRGP